MATESSQSPPIDSYLKISPDAAALDTQALESTFKRLHSIGFDARIEIRLVATDHTTAYYVGTGARQLRTLKRALSRLFSDGTELKAEAPPDLPEDPTAALEFQGQSERRQDWQTRIQPVHDGRPEHAEYPLAAVVDTIADTTAATNVVYQAILTPKQNWEVDASVRKTRLKESRDSWGQQFSNFLFSDYTYDGTIEDATPRDTDRIHSINDTDPAHSFSVYARAIATGDDAPAVLSAVDSAFQSIDGQFYRLETTVQRHEDDIERITDCIERSAVPATPSLWSRLAAHLPITGNVDHEIVTDPLTAPNLCLFDGDSVSQSGQRALAVTPEERTAMPRPETELLTQYDAGMLLGYPLTNDNTTADDPVALPPSLQPLHAAWFGKTGSGKSTALLNAILENHSTTDGADILIDPKGDGMPKEYLQAHYAEHGDLDDVYYFDCAETLPAIPFFDIRKQLADGIARTTAVQDITHHYIELLIAIMGKDRFEQAVRSPDIIRYLVKALFDPIHGSDAFTHHDLQAAATRMRNTKDVPPVSDRDLERMLSGVTTNSDRSFDQLLRGVANRIEKVPVDDRLSQLFNHVPGEGDPQFDLREVIDEDAVVILDTGELRSESRRVVTLVLLSQLWTALRRRTQTTDDEPEPPLVNLYLEEAATVASSGLVSDLLSRSRAFGLSMTLAMQFPGQLREADSEAYAEVVNNVSTIITGNVAVDTYLQKRLATEDMPPAEVANRLGALQRGQWIASLPSEFGTVEPLPFLLESAPIPPGHPESEQPLSATRETAFEAAFDTTRDRTRLDHGIDLANATAANATATSGEPTDSAAESEADLGPTQHSDSVLPYTTRLPDVVEYDDDRHALVCPNCESRYNPTRDGIERAIECCHSREDVSRDNVPICSLSLKLSRDERLQSPYSDAQLRFLHAVYAAHQRRFDPELEFDLIKDSMIHLQGYVGIEPAAVDELLEAGLLVRDCQHPHCLYTVTPEGRDAAKIRHREGIAHGDGIGDLSESSLHVAMVELGKRYVQEAFVDDPESAAVEVRPYYGIDGVEEGNGRLDVAGLNADGEVVVTVEAERSNHDIRRAAPDDYDKMASVDPNAAIWIAKSRNGAHDTLNALNEPADGEPRVEKTYSPSSPPQRFSIDTPGLTEMYTFRYVRNSLLA